MSGQKRSIEQTETENKAGRNRIRRPEGEISRCIEYTGWLYIAEKEQTSRDFHKKNVGGTGRKVVYWRQNNTKQHLFYDFTGWLKDDWQKSLENQPINAKRKFFTTTLIQYLWARHSVPLACSFSSNGKPIKYLSGEYQLPLNTRGNIQADYTPCISLCINLLYK